MKGGNNYDEVIEGLVKLKIELKKESEEPDRIDNLFEIFYQICNLTS